MPLLDIAFKSNPTEVREILSVLQKGTRVLHIVCSESKSHKEVSVIALVPRLKKTLEAFIYRVKQMLSINNCLSGFYFGVLKARNIQGEEISSQNPYVNEDSGDEESNRKPKKKTSAKNKKRKGEDQSQDGSDGEESAQDSNDDAVTIGDDNDEDGDGINTDEDDATSCGTSQYDDAVESFSISSSAASSSHGRKRKQAPAKVSKPKAKRRHSISTAYGEDETLRFDESGGEEIEDEAENDEEEEILEEDDGDDDEGETIDDYDESVGF